MRRWNAAGTWDLLAQPDFPYDAYVQKTVTIEPRRGDEWAWTPWGDGVVNRVGLVNPGVDRFVREVLPLLEAQPVPFAVSILGLSWDEWVRLAEIDADLEVNLACPNDVGEDAGANALRAQDIVSTVRKYSRRRIAARTGGER